MTPDQDFEARLGAMAAGSPGEAIAPAVRSVEAPPRTLPGVDPEIFRFRSGARLRWAADEPAADAGTGEAPAVEERIDKSKYHLFNPTPRAHMRELTTDRPDKTESPITVDAGHFQIEADIFTYTFDRLTPQGRGTDTHDMSWALSNLKMGLTNDIDMQFVIAPFNANYTRDRRSGAVDRGFGFGDLTIRTKFNIWGNDGGDGVLGIASFGVMPYITVPTGTRGFTDGHVQGGVIIPFAVDLPWEFSLGAMAQFDIVRGIDDSRHRAEFVQSITLSHALVGDLSGYVEFFNVQQAGRGGRWIATVDFGVTYPIGDNIQLDAGCNIGVTPSAPDWNPFVGITIRH